MNLWVIFLTGLTVGGLTCLAVQGGLLASLIASKEEEEVQSKIRKKNSVIPTVIFLIAKLVAYTILGFILGGFGGAITINQTVLTLMQFIAGAYMLLIALNLLEVHPIFRYAVIQPPRFLTRLIRNQSKSKDIFAPALLGAMTIFIPCGTTLAMEALAISSRSPYLGALIMAVFVLGTTPLFFGIGWITSILGDNFRGRFLKIAAIAVIYLGLASINGALIALDFPINSHTIAESVRNVFQANQTAYNTKKPITQTAEIIVSSGGYSPSYIRVKQGVPVSLTVTGKDAYSCASAFRIPSLGISRNLQANESYTVAFTPKEKGKIRFTCSMGMYSGVIEVL